MVRSHPVMWWDICALPVALIGPAGTGKSTVGEIVAGLLDRDFVDIDAIGHRYYDTVGQPVSDPIERIQVDTFRRAHRWWQPARLAALANFPTAVIVLGAGHIHFEDEERFEEAARVLGTAFVVLLLPAPDLPDHLGRDRRSRLTERLMDCHYETRQNVHRHGDLLCMEHTLGHGT